MSERDRAARTIITPWVQKWRWVAVVGFVGFPWPPGVAGWAVWLHVPNARPRLPGDWDGMGGEIGNGEVQVTFVAQVVSLLWIKHTI